MAESIIKALRKYSLLFNHFLVFLRIFVFDTVLLLLVSYQHFLLSCLSSVELIKANSRLSNEMGFIYTCLISHVQHFC